MILDIRVKDPDVIPTTQISVLVQSDNTEELSAKTTREAVMNFARKQGFPASGLSFGSTAYPVDEKGETHADMLTGKRAVKCMEIEYTVQARLGG